MLLQKVLIMLWFNDSCDTMKASNSSYNKADSQRYGSSSRFNCWAGVLFLVNVIAPCLKLSVCVAKSSVFVATVYRRIVVRPGAPWQRLVSPFYVFAEGKDLCLIYDLCLCSITHTALFGLVCAVWYLLKPWPQSFLPSIFLFPARPGRFILLKQGYLFQVFSDGFKPFGDLVPANGCPSDVLTQLLCLHRCDKWTGDSWWPFTCSLRKKSFSGMMFFRRYCTLCTWTLLVPIMVSRTVFICCNWRAKNCNFCSFWKNLFISISFKFGTMPTLLASLNIFGILSIQLSFCLSHPVH